MQFIVILTEMDRSLEGHFMLVNVKGHIKAICKNPHYNSFLKELQIFLIY